MNGLLYINWNPDGTLLDLGFYQLRWYSLLFGIGFIVGYLIVKKEFQKKGISQEKLDSLTVYTIVATLLGARLGHCLFYDWGYFSNHLLEIFLPFRFEPTFEFIGFQGLASHGGGIGILIALLIFSKLKSVNLLFLFDTFSLAIPFGGTCIRLGNLMNSEIIGSPTDVSWAFIFEQVDTIPRHPAQLYEALLYLVIFFILYFWVRKLNKAPGFITGVFFMLIFVVRFVVEFVKADQVAFEADMTLNMGQWLSIPFIIAGLVFIFLKNRTKQQDAY